MKKNDLITATILDLGSNCEGICKVDGYTCFIPFTIVGEKIIFKVLKVNKNLVYGKLVETLTPQESRVRPKCQAFTKCGGCNLQHIRYKDQLKIKSNIIKTCFKKIAGLDVDVLPVQYTKEEYFYRNKIQLPIRQTENGVKVGFFATNSHRIVEIDSCPIQHTYTTSLIKATKEFILKSGISCYNEENNQGLLKHIVARNVDGKILIIVVINGIEFNYKDLFASILSKYFDEFSLILNENTLNNNVILSKNFKTLYGNGYYNVEEFGIKYPVYPQSFMQVNDGVKTSLYQDVVSSLNITSDTVVIDAYSGAGVMTAMLAKNAKKAIGIEIVKEAVDSANKLKELNGLSDKIQNYLAPCEEVLPSIIESETINGSKVAVVLDPPRKGCDERVLSAILKSKPDRIVYVACSPQSLARDVGVLVGSLVWENGELKKNNNDNGIYKIEKVVPYEMFPQTKHIESVVCLTRRLDN